MAATKTAVYVDANGEVAKYVFGVDGDNFSVHDEAGLTRVEFDNATFEANETPRIVNGKRYYTNLMPQLRDAISPSDAARAQKIQDKLDDIAAFDTWKAQSITDGLAALADFESGLNPPQQALWAAYLALDTEDQAAIDAALQAVYDSLNAQMKAKFDDWLAKKARPGRPTIR